MNRWIAVVIGFLFWLAAVLGVLSAQTTLDRQAILAALATAFGAAGIVALIVYEGAW